MTLSLVQSKEAAQRFLMAEVHFSLHARELLVTVSGNPESDIAASSRPCSGQDVPANAFK